MTPAEENMTKAEFAAFMYGPFSEYFGEGFEDESLTALIQVGERNARRIIRRLKPFAKSRTFPEVYNLRATHALFALAFLYYSPHFQDFCKQVKRLNVSCPEKPGDRKALIRMITSIRNYDYMSQFKGKSVRLYNEMNRLFIDHHREDDYPAIIEDQVILVVDFMNPVEKIKVEIESIINRLQSELDDLVPHTVDRPGEKKCLPSRFGMPLVNDQGQTVLNPEEYLPHWYEALLIHRMRKRGRSQARIIKDLYKSDKTQNRYESKRTIIHNRHKLAKRLIKAAFHRVPLTSQHVDLCF